MQKEEEGEIRLKNINETKIDIRTKTAKTWANASVVLFFSNRRPGRRSVSGGERRSKQTVRNEESALPKKCPFFA